MMKSILEITNAIFEKIPYSRQTEEAKTVIQSALEKEYQRLISCGKNDVQALGEIMYKYGTIDDAAAFAEIDLQKLYDSSADKVSFDSRSFKSFSAISGYTLLSQQPDFLRQLYIRYLHFYWNHLSME